MTYRDRVKDALAVVAGLGIAMLVPSLSDFIAARYDAMTPEALALTAIAVGSAMLLWALALAYAYDVSDSPAPARAVSYYSFVADSGDDDDDAADLAVQRARELFWDDPMAWSLADPNYALVHGHSIGAVFSDD